MNSASPKTATRNRSYAALVGALFRQCAAAELQASGLWLPRGRANVIHDDQSARGGFYIDTVLSSHLGTADQALLRSSRMFGGNPMRRLRTTAGFGHQLAAGLARICGQNDTVRKARQNLATCFFLFTAIFDSLCDSGEPFATLVPAVFNLPLLHLLLDDPERAGGGLRNSPAWNNDALRILLKVAIAFFTGLRRIDIADDDEVKSLIETCYRAEVDTISSGTMGIPAAGGLTDLSAKSRLPFCIIARIVREPRDDFAEAASVAAALGDLVWRVDDMADLADDLRTGSFNSIAQRAAAETHSHDVAVMANHMLRPGIAKREVIALRHDLQILVDRLTPLRIFVDGGWSFVEWILAAIRGWLDPVGRR